MVNGIISLTRTIKCICLFLNSWLSFNFIKCNTKLLSRQCVKIVSTVLLFANHTYYRLSKLMGQKLTDNNPNIADLSDMNRPTKLAERYVELYDNQWTDAFEIIYNNNDNGTIGLLLHLLKARMLSVFCLHRYISISLSLI